MTINDIAMQEDEKKVIEDFLATYETSKRIEKDKKILNEKVKNIFAKYKINDPLNFNGSTLTVTETVRKTVTAKKKDAFIQKLLELGKNYLITTSIEIDTDTIYAEVENGQLDKTFVEEYMSITPEKRLTVK